MTIGKRIARCRKEKGLSQEDIAEMVGVSRQAVSKWENDLTAPDTYNLIELAKIFDVSVEYLALGGEVEKSQEQNQAKEQSEDTHEMQKSQKSKSFSAMVAGFFVFSLGIMAFAFCCVFILSDTPITIPTLFTVFIPILSLPSVAMIIGWKMMF